MTARQNIEEDGALRQRNSVGNAVHAAVGRGLTIGKAVRLGVVSGIVIGYNIARRGRYPGARFPLLVKTDLGVAKCCLEEVVPA